MARLATAGGMTHLQLPDRPASVTAVSGNPFRDLIDLMLLAERGRLTTSPLSFEGVFAPSLLRQQGSTMVKIGRRRHWRDPMKHPR
jgi:hypothetical protein